MNTFIEKMTINIILLKEKRQNIAKKINLNILDFPQFSSNQINFTAREHF